MLLNDFRQFICEAEKFAMDHPEIRNVVIGHDTIAKFFEVIPEKLVTKIQDLEDGDDMQWLQNIKTVIEKEYGVAAINLRFEENIKINEEKFKSALSKSSKVIDESQGFFKGYHENQWSSYLKNKRSMLFRSISLRKPVKKVEKKLIIFKRTVSEFTAAFSNNTKAIGEWKSDIKDIEKALAHLKIEELSKDNLSPPVTKEADHKEEEKSVNLESEVQTIDSEENDVEIFEALKNLPKVPTDPVFRTKGCEEIEDKLLKLKFFNKTWLQDKSSDPQHAEDKTSTQVEDSADASKEPIDIEEHVEPFFSSSDDQQDFNDWYEQKIEESKPPKKKVKKPHAKCEPCVPGV